MNEYTYTLDDLTAITPLVTLFDAYICDAAVSNDVSEEDARTYASFAGFMAWLKEQEVV